MLFSLQKFVVYFTKATKIYQFYQNCSKLNNKYEIIITLSLGTSSLVKLSPLPLNVGIYFEKPRHVIKRYFWYFYRGLVLSSRVIYRLNKISCASNIHYLKLWIFFVEIQIFVDFLRISILTMAVCYHG